MTQSINKKKYKICRRLGSGVYEQCQNQKFILSQAKKSKTSGAKRGRVTDYGLSLLDKQRISFSYGVREKQFYNYVKEALSNKDKKVVPSMGLFQLLEARLDNTLYRVGFAHTRNFSRQLASHGHFMVNGRRVTIPSYRLKVGDVIALRDGAKNKVVFQDLAKKLKNTKTPDWISLDTTSLTATVKGVPKDPDPFFNFQSVIEFYSKA